ncbi:MAG: N-acetylmuramoyl-L-alanine amidase [Egibacteraceae bacterium]
MPTPDRHGGDNPLDADQAPTWTRRRFLAAAGLAAAGTVVGPARRHPPALAAAVPPPAIRPRAAWAGGLLPQGPLEVEAPGDTRFLIVHHTATASDYTDDAVPGILQSIYRYHTGPKGWPDVAYNFFVDRFGGVWEGRSGSLDGPVKGSATGGSQGFAQLCTFVGDHTQEAPTPAAQDAMVGLLALLAGRYAIDPRPGAQASFVSRGSNRWPQGHPVTTPTIAGHRDMSLTTCPGDAAYAMVTVTFPPLVAQRLAPGAAPAPGAQGPDAAPAAPAEPEAPPAPPDPAPEPAPHDAVPVEPVAGGPAQDAPAEGVVGAVGAGGGEARRWGAGEVGTVTAAAAGLGAVGVAAARSLAGRRTGDADERPTRPGIDRQ